MTTPGGRVAVLSPVAWRTPPRQYGAWETVASNIAEGLVARGWDVTLFASRDSVTRAHRIPASEQGHIPATGDESFGDIASHRFPGTVLPGRRSPGYR